MKIGNYQITRDTLILPLGAFIVLFNFYNLAWLPVDPYIQRGTFLSVFIVLSMLFRPPQSTMGKIIMAIFTLMALTGSIYPIIFHNNLTAQVYVATPRDTIIFVIFLVGMAGVLTRVDGGLVVLCLLLFSVLYLSFGRYIPGIFGLGPRSLGFITTLLYTDISGGVFGSFLDIFVRIVSIFIIFASFLYIVGLGELFTALALWIAGNATGGPAKVSVISSALFGMISGSAVSNVVADGAITIPTMKNVGYSPPMAASIEAIASTGGIIMPPIMGAGAFLMADILGIPYLQICVAAIIPAFLWYFTLYLIVHFYALRVGIRKWRPSREATMAIVRAKWHFLFAIFALFFALYYFSAEEQGAFWAVVFLVLLSFIRKGSRLTRAKIASFLRLYVNMFSGLFVLCAALAIFVTALTGSGAHLKLGRILLGGIEQWYWVLLIVFVLTLVLGLGVGALGVYLAAAAIAVPILAQLGFNVLASHFFVFYLAALSPITPPVCMATFQAARIAQADLMKTGMVASIISLPLWIIPFLLVRKNLHFTIGTPIDVIGFELARICIGIFIFVLGTQGYFVRKLGRLERIVAVTIGVMILQPVSDQLAIVFLVIGVALVVFWILSRLMTRKKERQQKDLASSTV